MMTGQRIRLHIATLALSFIVAVSLVQADKKDPDSLKKGLGSSLSSGVNALNKLGGGLLHKVGGVATKVVNFKDVKAPASVAVLPATGVGTLTEQSEIRIALHNSLGSTNIRSLKPAQVDRLLVVAEQTQGQSWDQIPKQKLASIMAVEGLLLVDVEKVDRLYAGAYAHYEVGVKVSLYTSDTNKVVWERAETEAERKGGVSINPLGMIATAVSSARILTDAVRQVLVNTLARRIAADIPQPTTFLKSKKPIIVDMAVSNGVEGPFSVGDEITVLAKAEPGLVMFFDLNGLRKDIPLDEKAEGEYIGSYVIAEGNDANNLFISLRATRISDKASLTWRVPGKLEVDTIPPGVVSAFKTNAISSGIALSWQAPKEEDLASLSYRLERANVNDGIYKVIAEVAITEYQDTAVLAGDSYYYRIRSVDNANNEGGSVSRKVSVFKPGPTQLSGLLEGKISFPAIGNPYRLSENLTIASGAEISFDEGTILELSPGQKITVQGALILNGSETRQVTVRGDGWGILYDGVGASASAIQYARLSGLNTQIAVAGSSLALTDVITDGLTLVVEQYGAVNIRSSQMLNAEPALRLILGELSLGEVRLSNNIQAIVSVDRAGQSSLLMNKVVFERNQTALSTLSEYILSGVEFLGANLSEIQGQLDGPISIDWNSMGGGKALVRSWLAPNMLLLKQALKREDWERAVLQIKKMRDVLPSAGLDRLADGLAQIEVGFANAAYDSRAQGIGSLLAEGNRTLWIQNEALPSAQSKSEELSTRTMLKKFGKSYVKELFPTKRGGELAKAIRGVDISAAVDASQYLYSIDKGLLSEVWMAHVVNQSVLNRALSSAGLGASKSSNHIFSVNIDNAAASNIILDILEAQKIRYQTLSTDVISAYRLSLIAYRLSANIVISDSESQLSKNLKVAEATVRLRLEEVGSADIMGSWKAVGSASAFGRNDAHKKALQTAIKKIESAMVKKLWAVDSRPLPTTQAAKKVAAPVPGNAKARAAPKIELAPKPEATTVQTVVTEAPVVVNTQPVAPIAAPTEPVAKAQPIELALENVVDATPDVTEAETVAPVESVLDEVVPPIENEATGLPVVLPPAAAGSI